ncbi:MAG: nitrilase [Pelagibacterales bacterium]|nr:nitrilase [Pelagibacterales bacterium]PPR16027.1 MAG: Nitrilase [Alphaproteobacteria bacterium MarineAlpha9_Bin3]|tara:strand:- start:15006 stop:15932 length:927 start_codon:yes stop_codon:yes gene_type:complete
MSFIAAVVQDCSVVFDLDSTIDKVDKITKDAREKNVDLIVFPEAFISAYPKGLDFGARIGMRSEEGRIMYSKYYNSALDFNSIQFKKLCNIAKKYKILTSIGVIEKDNGTLYCTALIISKKGELLGKHRKIMPTAMERLIWGFGDGSTLPVIDTNIGKIGSVICWENYMPLMRMAMYSKGIQLYCAPTADDRDTWISSMIHTALEGRCFVFSSCQYLLRKDCPDYYNPIQGDKNSTVIMKGGSCIIDPLGKVIAGPLRDKAGILTAKIDLNEIIKAQYDFDVKGHYSRPDIFKLNVNEKENKPTIYDK